MLFGTTILETTGRDKFLNTKPRGKGLQTRGDWKEKGDMGLGATVND